MFKQLLHEQILKEEKKTDNLTTFFALSGSVGVKAACKNIAEIETCIRVN